MARSRRSSGARGRRRHKVDWVYNERSYATAESTLASGIAAAIAFPLTLSQNTRRLIASGTPGVLPGVNNYQSWAAIPEGSKQRVFAVEANLMVQPTTWVNPNEFRVGFRLLHGEQEAGTADLITQVNYSMFVISVDAHPAQWANAGFLREWHFSEGPLAATVISTRGQFLYRLRWRSPKGILLGNDRALFIYAEAAVGSTQLRVRPFCRTLCEVSGQP